ncbi:DUF6516 family protein [Shinella sp. WSJ-2]|uniref:toxin-antitoxin system TumE family protein n=1 Tax=Shinella sp. WSJ-2 TaxID=2303749 RepID=UPI001FDF84EE|nr:DUF6516 family protein [Shinella sp. WSJ-2]
MSTFLSIDGINANMDAVLLERSKTVLPDGSIVEIVLWQVPEPVAGSEHCYKYRLFYGRDGRRIVGFDNERGKGDHCHLDGRNSAMLSRPSRPCSMIFEPKLPKGGPE